MLKLGQERRGPGYTQAYHRCEMGWSHWALPGTKGTTLQTGPSSHLRGPAIREALWFT